MGCTSGNNDFFQNWEAGFKDGNRFFVGHTAWCCHLRPRGPKEISSGPCDERKKVRTETIRT
jgi:hypothetical protein